MNKQIATIAEREVTRKEFLTMAGLGLMSIMGFGSIIRLLSGKHSLGSHASSGYGSNGYGR